MSFTEEQVLFQDQLAKAIKMARRLDLKSIIQKVHPLSNYEQAFADLYTKKYAKVVIKMDE